MTSNNKQDSLTFGICRKSRLFLVGYILLLQAIICLILYATGNASGDIYGADRLQIYAVILEIFQIFYLAKFIIPGFCDIKLNPAGIVIKSGTKCLFMQWKDIEHFEIGNSASVSVILKSGYNNTNVDKIRISLSANVLLLLPSKKRPYILSWHTISMNTDANNLYNILNEWKQLYGTQ